MSLDAYRKKRYFQRIPEQKDTIKRTSYKLYVIQKHVASHLHYDFRLELDGTLKSWVIPKGPCLDPSVKRLAVLVEDHPLEYGSFEGIIPEGEYGAGTVILWDTGEWRCLDADSDKAFKDGHLRIELYAKKLNGRWDLVRFKPDKEWFLIKGCDRFAKPLGNYDITIERPDSVLGQQVSGENKKLYLLDNLPESSFPEAISPQLATLVDRPPESNRWVHEIKFDGYRMLAFKQGESVHIKSRNHHDWTIYFPTIVTELRALPVQNAIFDGEIILQDKLGRSNFQLLQNAIKNNVNASFQYYIFDCIYAEKYNLKLLTLLQRKMILKHLLGVGASVLHYSDHTIGNGEAMYSHACDLGLEGIVSKDINSHYVERRSKSWLKIKCVQRQEFVIGGYSDPKGGRKHFGSLYLGFFNDASDLIYCGKVGTGFTTASLKEIYSELQKNHTSINPFDSNMIDSHAHWVKPTLVAEIKFSEWTKAGRLRHSSFQGLRLDKKATLVKKEKKIPVRTLKEGKYS